MHRLARYLLAVLVCCSTLAACGFALRGTTDLPFDSLYINVPDNSRFGSQLRRQVLAASPGLVITEDSKRAEAQLQLLDIQRDRNEVALTAQGRVQEYELTLLMTFQVVDARGELLIPPTTLTATRALPYDDNVSQAKEMEAQMLYDAMQADLAQRILHRLGAAETHRAASDAARTERDRLPVR